ncbi:MAG: XdhC family protein [Alphaproteobacteria bacterium]|nr:XdhC family protein [Alphaproteobacteria bacterium]
MLATITGLTGTGARAIGTHMAVLDDGASAGSFSSGCVEAAIVAEAQAVLAEGRPRTTRFGQDSPYMDIRLPCGGGMDVRFVPDPPAAAMDRAASLLAERSPITLFLDGPGGVAVEPGWSPQDDGFRVRHAPALRVVLLGHGAEMVATLKLGLAHGADIVVVSPEADFVAEAEAVGAEAHHLKSPGSPVALAADPWTALLYLFHDHDWEPDLMERGLATPAFWIGAMGSRRTQAARRAALSARGVDAEAIARIQGPVGLIPSSRDPATLALSAFAEIVGAYQQVAA